MQNRELTFRVIAYNMHRLSVFMLWFLQSHRPDKLKRARVSKKTFTIILTKAEEGGYIAECLELPTAHSQGDTVEEAVANVKDANH